jgi:hypothetical protein
VGNPQGRLDQAHPARPRDLSWRSTIGQAFRIINIVLGFLVPLEILIETSPEIWLTSWDLHPTACSIRSPSFLQVPHLLKPLRVAIYLAHGILYCGTEKSTTEEQVDANSSAAACVDPVA